MSDLLQFVALLQVVAVVLLALIWRRTGRAASGSLLKPYLDRMDERLENIEQRLRDNFETDEERQDRIDMTPGINVTP